MSSTKKKKPPPKVSEMTKEQLQAFLLKKKQAENTAHTLVVAFAEMDKATDRQVAIALPRITAEHWDNVAEERALVSRCGLPLCDKNLKPVSGNQQYSISLKTNKVYDVSFRKNFCSGYCYKTFTFIKQQIPSDPIWWRGYIDSKQFIIRPPNGGALVGDEVDISLYKKVEKDENKTPFSSVFDLAEATFAEMEDETSSGDKKESPKDAKSENTHETKETIEKTEEVVEAENKKSKPKQPIRKPFFIGEVVEKPSENRVDPMISAGKKLIEEKMNKCKSAENATAIETNPGIIFIVHIEKCLGEWLTLDSLLHLLGEAKVKELAADKGQLIKEYLNNMANGLLYEPSRYERYQKLCRKLNMLELEDWRYDKSVVADTTRSKPLPSYSMLKEENKMLEIKVKAFFKGELTIPVPDPEETEEEPIEDDDENRTNIPLVDKTAQNALRRRIVLNALNKTFPEICRNYGISSFEIAEDVRQLVNTFDLRSDNITFKTAQWTLIAMVVLKLVSLKNSDVERCLNANSSEKYTETILQAYKKDGGYLKRLVEWLIDIDRFLNVEDKQLTVM